MPREEFNDVFARLQKGPTQQIVISEGSYGGQKRVDIRNFYLDEEDQWQPTRKGVSIPYSQWVEFFHFLTRLNEKLEEGEEVEIPR